VHRTRPDAIGSNSEWIRRRGYDNVPGDTETREPARKAPAASEVLCRVLDQPPMFGVVAPRWLWQIGIAYEVALFVGKGWITAGHSVVKMQNVKRESKAFEQGLQTAITCAPAMQHSNAFQVPPD
jgi:hypothetical protein